MGQHGLVVITREGNNPNKFIYESDLLTKYQVTSLSCVFCCFLYVYVTICTYKHIDK